MQRDQHTHPTVEGNFGRLAEIDFLQVKKSSLILRAINHKLRQDMLKLLEKRGSLTVTEIYAQLRLEPSEASQHLAILRRSDVVQTKRDGKKVYYQLNDRRLIEISSFVNFLLEKC